MTEQEALDALTGFLATWAVRMPAVAPAGAVAWRRDGLVALHSRLEQLKQDSHAITALLEEATLLLGRARRAARGMGNAMDDAIGGGEGAPFESRISMMANRGMAADERRLAHELRANPQRVWRNAFLEVADELDGVVRAIQARAYSVRDERSDIRSQLRAIQVGLEIGEV